MSQQKSRKVISADFN